MTIQNPIKWLFLFHAIAGAIALLMLLFPLMSKKGGLLHRKSGWFYTFAMIFVALSAQIVTPWRIFLDPHKTQSSVGFAVFLFFIAVFTLASLWFGLVVLKCKDRTLASKEIRHVGPPIALIAIAVGTQVTGFLFGNTLLIAFPFIALFSAKTQLNYWLRVPENRMHWWVAHMNGMGTAGIATVTAFLVTALPRIWPNPITNSLILWIAPGVILGTLLNRWTSRYRVSRQLS